MDAGSFDMMGLGWFQAAFPVPKPKPPPSTVVPPPADVSQVPVSAGVQTITVDEAWHLFGFPKKRATREAVKERYLALVVKYHPDRHIRQETKATEAVVKINAAWTLLQRHCKW